MRVLIGDISRLGGGLISAALADDEMISPASDRINSSATKGVAETSSAALAKPAKLGIIRSLIIGYSASLTMI